jgi:large subunit ribosomal protein L30
MEQVKVTQVKSSIGIIPKHRQTLRALGLRKIGHSRIHQVNKVISGMIDKVKYLVKVEKA